MKESDTSPREGTEHEAPPGDGGVESPEPPVVDPPVDENDERPLNKRIEDEERERQQRASSLNSLFHNDFAGRDRIDRVSHQATHGGRVYSAGGDIHLHDIDGDAPQIQYMLRKSLEELAQYVVESPSLEELKRLVKGEPLVFLRGAEGTGRMTTATAALLNWVRVAGRPAEPEEAEENIGVIHYMASPYALAVSDLCRGHGYILSDPDSLDQTDVHDERLRSLAAKSECRVVVLVPNGRRVTTGRVIGHQEPSAMEVFQRRFDYEARAGRIEPEQLPMDIIQEMLDESSPAKASDLACQIVDGIRIGRTIDEIVADLPDRVRDEVCVRLGKGLPILGRCFMAAAAVLYELPETVVSKAALMLADSIHEAWYVEKKDWPLPGWEQLRTWLEYAGATIVTPSDASSGRTVHLTRKAAARETLRALWEDQPTIREPLIHWLETLAHDAKPIVQVRAAHAVGLLAILDFDHIQDALLVPWGRSRSWRDHRLAAMSLEAMANDGRLVGQVHGYLRRLAESKLIGERAVAVRAYGSAIGQAAPEKALLALRKIALSPDLRLADAVAGSIAYLYSASTSTEIVRELVSWLAFDEQGGWLAAANALTRLAAIPAGNPARPPLSSEELDVELVARLWWHALTLKYSGRPTEVKRLAVPEAWEQLGRWMKDYEEQPTIRAIIDRIIKRSEPSTSWFDQSFRLYLRLWLHRKQISLHAYEDLVHMI